MIRIKLRLATAAVGCLAVLFVACDGSTAPATDAGVDAACEAAAFEVCTDLSICCDLLLLLPPFFQQCQGVVLTCDEARCREVLEGYPICVFPEGGLPQPNSLDAQ